MKESLVKGIWGPYECDICPLKHFIQTSSKYYSNDIWESQSKEVKLEIRRVFTSLI